MSYERQWTAPGYMGAYCGYDPYNSYRWPVVRFMLARFSDTWWEELT